jgi:flagellar biosynthetic protein FliP
MTDCRARRSRKSLAAALLLVAAMVGRGHACLAQDSAIPKPITQTAGDGQLLGGLRSPLETNPLAPQSRPANSPSPIDVEQMLSPTGMSSTLKIMLLLTVISLAPSILIMSTCFMRFVIVFGLLRQALGTQQLPPNQVLVSLSLFLTFLVMSPVWKQSYDEGIRPYTSPAAGEEPVSLDEAFHRTARPLRRFMIQQIQRTDNADSVLTFLEFQNPNEKMPPPEKLDDVDTVVLLPAFMVSELKTAFVIGFQIYLPFLVIDMVIATVLISMGMMMLPPVLISLPFKLLLFVLIDGWALTVGMLLESVRVASG